VENLSSYNNTYNNKNKNNSILFTALITINTIFGLQILNSFVTLLNNFLRERPNISLIQVGIYAIVTFLVVFLAGFLFLVSTKKILLPVLIALISAARLIIQINPWPPLSLSASALGTVLWMVSIVFFISLVQEKRIGLVNVFFPSLFLGFAAATGIYGMFGTWDLIWQDNAILSKYPLKLLKSGFLPRLDAPLRRSYLLAEADLANNSGIDRNINIMCTHIHHIKGEGSIREEQVKAILDAGSGLERAAIMGDFNAQSGEPEIQMMHDAGFIDSQAALGKDSQLTWVHYEPLERIDYIWVTPDIEISNLFVPYSTASDHLPVVIDIR